MKTVTFLAIASLSALSSSVASPAASRLNVRSSPVNGIGVHDGVFYYWWSDYASDANYTNGPGGSYSVAWSNKQGNWVGGKGWSPGSTTRVAHYEGTFEPEGNAYLSLYGVSRYREYYVMESYGTFNPAAYFQPKGSINCNGAHYDVVVYPRIPPGLEPISFTYYSVRNPKLPSGYVSGTIDFACHVEGWARFNITLPPELMEYQVMATEGYYSSGYSNITVS